MSGFETDTKHADDAAFEAMMLAALADAPPLPAGYATRIAARAMEAARERMTPWWRKTPVMLAFGGGWAMATLVAGILVANLYMQPDFDPVSLADMALGTVSTTGVN